MNPHEILGLDPDEQDPAVVKRAYVAALRRHRPDEDPEGFRRVREAYEWLTAWIKYGEEDDERPFPEPDVDLVPLADRAQRDATAPEPPPLPTPDAPLAERIQRDIASPAVRAWRAAQALPSGEPRTEALRRAARAMAQEMRGAPECVAHWTQELLSEWGDDAAALAGAVRLDDLIAELEGGEVGVSRTVFEHAFDKRKFRRLADAAERILASASPHMEPLAQSGLHAWLAEALALAYPELARRLVDHAFEIVPPEARAVAGDDLDEVLAAGAEIAFWPEPDRLEVARLALDGVTARSESASRAVVRKAESLGDMSLLFAMVRNAAPALVNPDRVAREPEPSRGSWVWAIIAILVVVKWLARCDGAPPGPPTGFRDSMERTDEILRRSRELLENREPSSDDEELERIKKMIDRLNKEKD